MNQSKDLSAGDNVCLIYSFKLFSLVSFEAVIHEAQRVSNTVPLSVFHCTTENTQLNGYSIPKVRNSTHIKKKKWNTWLGYFTWLCDLHGRSLSFPSSTSYVFHSGHDDNPKPVFCPERGETLEIPTWIQPRKLSQWKGRVCQSGCVHSFLCRCVWYTINNLIVLTTPVLICKVMVGWTWLFFFF